MDGYVITRTSNTDCHCPTWVIRHGGGRRASAQSAVSLQIRSLEEEFNALPSDRSSRLPGLADLSHFRLSFATEESTLIAGCQRLVDNIKAGA
jgi:hypothetical protein